jgi:hypothetical protein
MNKLNPEEWGLIVIFFALLILIGITFVWMGF